MVTFTSAGYHQRYEPGVSLARLPKSQAVMSGQVDREQSLREASSACVEEALLQLKLHDTYTAGTATIGTASCSIAVSGTGTSRTIVVTATDSGYNWTANIGAIYRTNPAANAKAWEISSWSEPTP